VDTGVSGGELAFKSVGVASGVEDVEGEVVGAIGFSGVEDLEGEVGDGDTEVGGIDNGVGDGDWDAEEDVEEFRFCMAEVNILPSVKALAAATTKDEHPIIRNLGLE